MIDLLLRVPGQFSVTQTQSVRYRLGIMETRSRTRIRATNSPPREVTEGGTQPVRDVFVEPPSSAIGLSGDGKVSSRSTSLEDGSRSACRPTVCSESTDEEHGPAQGAMYEENREFMDTVCSDVVHTSIPDERQNSTLVPLLESGTRHTFDDILRRVRHTFDDILGSVLLTMTAIVTQSPSMSILRVF